VHGWFSIKKEIYSLTNSVLGLIYFYRKKEEEKLGSVDIDYSTLYTEVF